jgi:hypothetical protein
LTLQGSTKNPASAGFFFADAFARQPSFALCIDLARLTAPAGLGYH